MQQRSLFGWLVVVALLALSALVFWYASRVGSGAPDTQSDGPQSVDTVAVARQSMPVTIRSVGTARAAESVALTSEVEGRVESIHFEAGNRVAASDVLVRLESREERAAVSEAQARVRRASADLERERQLSQPKVVSESRLDQLAAELGVAQGQLEAARARLHNHTLRAPFAGRIGLRDVSPGAYVGTGTTIATLVDLDPIRLRFSVPDGVVGYLRPGLGVEARTDAYPQRLFAGDVAAVDTAFEVETRSLMVEAHLPNPDGALRPGMLLNVELIIDRRRDALVVPEAALVLRGDESYVYRVSDGTARRVAVRTGQRRAGLVEIRAGLAAGDRVVLRGVQKVQDGVPVEAQSVEFDYSAAGAGG